MIKSRFVLFMQTEGINSVRLAEKLDIQASTISHIISGRNKPGFDLLAKLFLTYPALNPKWLILGEGEMYGSYHKLLADKGRIGNSPELFDSAPEEQLEYSTNFIEPELKLETVAAQNDHEQKQREKTLPEQEARQTEGFDRQPAFGHKKIEKIVILYNDGTFESYNQSIDIGR
jgi:transcriptional regulator with XRE-family HTH domain